MFLLLLLLLLLLLSILLIISVSLLLLLLLIIFSSFNDNLLYDYDNEYSSHESKVNISCLFRYLSFSSFVSHRDLSLFLFSFSQSTFLNILKTHSNFLSLFIYMPSSYFHFISLFLFWLWETSFHFLIFSLYLMSLIEIWLNIQYHQIIFLISYHYFLSSLTSLPFISFYFWLILFFFSSVVLNLHFFSFLGNMIRIPVFLEFPLCQHYLGLVNFIFLFVFY